MYQSSCVSHETDSNAMKDLDFASMINHCHFNGIGFGTYFL
jgi:hypothetical protein